MSTTLLIESFAQSNLVGERTSLAAAYDPVADGNTLKLVSTAGYSAGQRMYVGLLGRDGCEKAIVDVINSPTEILLATPLGLSHSQSEPVASVLGDVIRVWRAADINGTPPDPSTASLLGTRDIDADQMSTYFTDAEGSSAWWYWISYYNTTTLAETGLGASVAVRGDDFGHYTSINAIRSEARLERAYNLSDGAIDQERRAAETEVNGTLSSGYTVPFQKPVPPAIQTITTQLAAALLLASVYGGQTDRYDKQLKDVRARLSAMALGPTVVDGAGVSLVQEAGVNSWPDDTTDHTSRRDGGSHRSFRMGDIY
jgi:hypothetical protein